MRMPALLVAIALLALVAPRCSSNDDQRRNTLEEAATQSAETSAAQRMAEIDKRLASIEEQLASLSRRIETGIVVAKDPKLPAKPAHKGQEQPAPAAQEDNQTAQDAAQAPTQANAPFELTWTPTEKTRIVLWHAYRGREKAALESAIKVFVQNNPNFDIDAQEVPFSALRDKVTVTIPKGTGPDLFVFAHNTIGDWVFKGGIIAPLSSLIEEYDDFETLETRFIPSTVKALGYQGTLYGLPLAFKSHALFYNKKLVPKAPTTTTELIELAKAAQAAGGKTDDDSVFGLLYDAGLFYNHALWAHAYGDSIMDSEGNCTVNGDGMNRSVQFVRSLAKEHAILGNLDDNMGTFLFNSQRVAFLIKGSWFLGEVDESVDYAVALLPPIEEGILPRPFLGSEGVFLSNATTKKEAAFQVMRWLVSDEAAAIRLIEGQQLVANSALYSDPQLVAKANPALELFRKQADNTVIMPSRPEMQAVWSTLDNALRKAIFGDADISAALNEAQAKIENDIQKMRQR